MWKLLRIFRVLCILFLSYAVAELSDNPKIRNLSNTGSDLCRDAGTITAGDNVQREERV
jgi:hypothetical protein